MMLLPRWLNPLRFLLIAFLIVGTASTAYAVQDGGLKGGQSEDDDDAPGLIEDGLYESPQFGVEVTWTDAWEVGSLANPDVVHAIGGQFDGPVASDGDLGDIIFLVDTASESSVLSIGFSPSFEAMDPDLLLTAIEDPSFLTDNLYLSEDAEIVLLDTDDEHVAVVAREAAPNDEHVVYMMITADPGRDDFSFWVGLDMYDATEYEAILTSLEDDIDIDGLDPLPAFDAEEILDALESGSAPATEEPTEVPATEIPATETPEVTEEPATEAPDVTEVPATETPESTEEPVILPPGTEEDGTPGPFVPDGTPIASPAASPVADDLPGLVGEGEFESPIYGLPITWSSDWVLNEHEAPAIRSLPESGVEEIFLTRAGEPEVTVYLSIEPSYGVTDTGEMLTALSDPAFFSRIDLPEGTEVALSREQSGRVAVMYLAPTGEDPTVVILEAHVLDDDTVLYIELRGPATSIDESLLDLTEDTIEAAGEDAMDILDASDVVAALP